METTIDQLQVIPPPMATLPPPSSRTTTKDSKPQTPATSIHPIPSSMPPSPGISSSAAISSPSNPPSPISPGNSSSSNSTSLGLGAIIGIAVGGVVLVLMCCGGWLFRRRRSRQRELHGLRDQEAMERLSRQQREKRTTLTLSKSIHKPLDFTEMGVSPSREEIHGDYHEQHSLHQRPSLETPWWRVGNNNNRSPLDYQRQVPPVEELYRTTVELSRPPSGPSSNRAAASSPALTLVTNLEGGTGKLPNISPLSPMGSIFSGRSLKRLSTLLAESVGYYPPPPVPSVPSVYMLNQEPPPIPLLTRPGPPEATGSTQAGQTTPGTSAQHASNKSPEPTSNTTPGKSQDSRRDSGPRLGGRKARVPSRGDGSTVPPSESPC